MREHRVRIVNVKLKADWKPSITDHAVLRFIERVHGVDVEALRDTMRTRELKTAILFGADAVRMPDGAKMIIDKGRVVTVLGPPTRKTKAKRPSRARMEKDAAE